MSVIVILILASLALGLVFLVGFVWAVRAGQYDDTSTPSLRLLSDDGSHPPSSPTVAKSKSIST